MKNLLLTAAACMALAAASIGQTLPAYLPSDGLVGWWPFNGNANDESGNGNNGTVNSATLTTDRFGNPTGAYNFNNSNLLDDDYIQLPILNSNMNSDFTFSVWSKLDVITSSYPVIAEGNNATFELSYFTQGENPLTSFYYEEFEGSGTSFGGVSAPCNPMVWQNTTIVSKNFRTYLYIDGELVSISNSLSSNQAQQISNFIQLGKGSSSFYNAFNGNIDDVAFFTRALDYQEILSISFHPAINFPSNCQGLTFNLLNNLVSFYPFCGNTEDWGPNNIDGLSVGAESTSDRFGNAYSAYKFNNSTDNNYQFVEIPTGNTYFDSNFTISIWSRLDYWSSQYPQFLFGDNANLNWTFTQNGSDSIVNFFFEPFSNSGIQFGNVSGNLDPFTWNHLVLISENYQNKLFINGNLAGTSNQVTPQQSQQNSEFLRLGFGPSNLTHFNGSLDDIGIWNRALTAEEVQQLYTLNACTFTIYDTVTVTQTVYDTVSVSVSTTDTLIINTLITSVEPAQENTFLVYPNPAGSQITINNGNVSILGGYTLRITNSAGQEVYNQNITQSEVTLDLGNWGGNGLYILYINDPSNNTIAVKQIVLQ
jgi:hypothetical protein